MQTAINTNITTGRASTLPHDINGGCSFRLVLWSAWVLVLGNAALAGGGRAEV
jgi:hypothetical protein